MSAVPVITEPQMFSDEMLIQYLNQLRYEWSEISPNRTIETALLKDNGYPEATRKSTAKLPILLKSLWELRVFDLDGYQYTVESDRVTRTGPKVRKAPPKPQWQVHRIGGPPTN